MVAPSGADVPGSAPSAASVLAVPADNNGPNVTPGFDANNVRKFYTLTTSLREVYDDNVGTTNNNAQTSLETVVAPSVLINLPNPEGSLTGRYTMTLTYYSRNIDANNGGGGTSNSNQLELSHEVDVQYTHLFSERYALNLAELFRYTTEPSLDQGTGTVYRNGPYVNNTLNGTLSAQWTPRMSTATTYSNIIINYDDSVIGAVQDSVENTFSQSVSFAVLPKISLSVGGIYDDITYKTDLRGYTNYTGFFGTEWKVLPTLSFSGRGGLSYAETVTSQASISPYVQVSMTWILGERSRLAFNYSHEITPTDQVGAQGQSSDRANVTFNYDITPRLAARLGAAFTSSTIPDAFVNQQQGAPVSSQETTYYVDSQLTYRFDKYIDIDTGVTLSANQSNIDSQSYTRQEFYAGIRGTY